MSSVPESMSPCCSRRRFVVTCAATIMAPMFGGCASMIAHTVPVVGGRITLSLADHPDLAIPGGSVRLQPSGLEDPVYVLALDNGQYAALSPICTHQGCTVDIKGAQLVCPCHGSTYDREGKVLQGPAEDPLTRYRVERVAGTTLVIDLSASS